MGILFQRRHLGDCLLLIKNGANIKQDKGTGGIPITRIETLSGGVFNRDRLGYAGIDQPGKYESFILESGDLLFSHINSKAYIGRTVLYQKEGSEVIIHGMNLLRIKVIPELLIPKYLYYTTLTEGFKSQVASSRKDAVNQSSISVSDIKRIIIPVPSLIEQQRIVDELDLLTDILDKKNAQLRDLDAYAQSLFYEMFGDPVINDKGWPQKKLNTVCDVRDGTHDSPKYLTYSDYILLTSKNIVGDSIDYSNINYISKEDYDAINKRSKVDEGDIIMAMIGTIGKPVIVHKEGYNFCVKNVALIKFQANSEVTNVYIRALLNSPSYSDYILSLNKGGTQKFVALGTLRSLPIPVPPMHVLEDFSIRISSIEKQSHLIRESIAELNQLLSCKMSQLFTQG